MNNLFNPADAAGIIQRLDALPATAQRQWGTMQAAQMLAHCTASLETAMGLNSPKKVSFLMRFVGSMMKSGIVSGKPMPKNSPTDKLYIITDARDFAQEKAKVIERIKAFSAGGPARCTTQPQVFFGPMTPQEWAIMQWKHFDHHLRQFGG